MTKPNTDVNPAPKMTILNKDGSKTIYIWRPVSFSTSSPNDRVVAMTKEAMDWLRLL